MHKVVNKIIHINKYEGKYGTFFYLVPILRNTYSVLMWCGFEFLYVKMRQLILGIVVVCSFPVEL